MKTFVLNIFCIMCDLKKFTFVYLDDDFYYFKLWMDHAGTKNINVQMPQILRNNSLTSDIKNDILSHWKKKAPQDYGKYFEASLLNKD